MKKLILLLLLIITSCKPNYTNVIDLEDGRIITIRQVGYDFTTNDTIVVYRKPGTPFQIYGKWVGKEPELSGYEFKKVKLIQ